MPENIPVAPNVVADELGEYPPVFQPPIKHLVTRPDATLHLEVLDGVDVVLGAVDLVHVSAVTVVGLDALTQLEEVCEEAGSEDLDVYQWPLFQTRGRECKSKSEKRVYKMVMNQRW